MKYTFQDAIAEILPHTVPEYFFRKDKSGKLDVRGARLGRYDAWIMTSRLRCQSAAVSEDQPAQHQPGRLDEPVAPLQHEQVSRRSRRRAREGLRPAGLPMRSSRPTRERAGAQNAVGKTDPRPARTGSAISKCRPCFRMIILKVMHENKIDVFVNPEQTTPPYLLGGAT